ncbi:hypothetical protein FB451DRAFT_1177650 [Mycena latifolia]|nr:hypothetical protein FB451DRAFT_1177650 [Mycena latifolia]
MANYPLTKTGAVGCLGSGKKPVFRFPVKYCKTESRKDAINYSSTEQLKSADNYAQPSPSQVPHLRKPRAQTRAAPVSAARADSDAVTTLHALWRRVVPARTKSRGQEARRHAAPRAEAPANPRCRSPRVARAGCQSPAYARGFGVAHEAAVWRDLVCGRERPHGGDPGARGTSRRADADAGRGGHERRMLHGTATQSRPLGFAGPASARKTPGARAASPSASPAPGRRMGGFTRRFEFVRERASVCADKLTLRITREADQPEARMENSDFKQIASQSRNQTEVQGNGFTKGKGIPPKVGGESYELSLRLNPS